MVAAPRQWRADARLLPRRGCAGPPILALPPRPLRRKTRPALVYPRGLRMSDTPEAGFAELVAATNYSFLRGASHPADMVAQARALGMTGIGIADRNSVAGVVRALTGLRLEEHTSELPSLMRISSAVFCLKKKKH